MPAKEHFLFLKKLILLEEDEENEEIRSEITSLTPQERELRGAALLGLVLEEKHYSPADHALATFRKKTLEPLPLFSLEVGDIVTLVSFHPQPVDPVTGTVYEKTKDSITVAFHRELPADLEEGALCDLHHSINQVTYKRMLASLDEVYETHNTRLAYFRDILLGEKKPQVITPGIGELKWLDENLNASQREAVKKCLSARDLALVHGPPGTGKTRVLVEIIRQCAARGQSVFVAAPSNTACDNVLERLIENNVKAIRLGHPARIHPLLREHTLDFRLALHPLAKQITDLGKELDSLFKRQDRYRARRSPGMEAEKDVKKEIADRKYEIRELRAEIFKLVMKEAQVFVGTPTGIRDKSLKDKEFDVLVIDEATQATEPLSWIPMTRANKVIMAGDHFQLPPTVRSKEAEKMGLGITLFERLHPILGDEFKTLLERQYRMNEKIMGFSSRMFYKNLLVAYESVRTQTIDGEPLLFIDTAGKGFEERLEEGSQSRFNPEEADIVLSQLSQMLAKGVPPEEIAVISPYSAQVRLLASKSPDARVEIDSVDGFQGREKELVIVSLVRANMEGEMGFLIDTRRMNVAMTRAKKKLIVIGDSATLSSIPFYKSFIEYAESVGSYKTIWELAEDG